MPTVFSRTAPFIAALVLCLTGCGPRAGIRGVLEDASGRPVSGVTVLAVKAGEEGSKKFLSAKVGGDATFSFEKLLPQSRYVLRVASKDWVSGAAFPVGTGQAGSIIPLPKPLVLRFTMTPDGVIKDSATGLEWLPLSGPGLDAYKAAGWARKQKAAGGGWHLPDISELKRLVSVNQESACQLDPLFNPGRLCFVWSNPAGDPRKTVAFDFRNGRGQSLSSFDPNVRTFAVRVAR